MRDVTASMLLGTGDDLPVSALPVDGTYPSGTTQYEKRNISDIDRRVGLRGVHPVRQLRVRLPARRAAREVLHDGGPRRVRPEGFQSAPLNAAGFPGSRYTLQVYAEDCTGCGLCVEACPVKPLGTGGSRKAINLAPVLDRDRSRSRT